LIRESIEVFTRSVGPNHPYTLQSRANLALVQYDSGDFEGARRSLAASLAPWIASIGEDSSHSAEQQCVAGLLDLRDGNVEAALKKLRDAHKLADTRGHSAARYRTRLA